MRKVKRWRYYCDHCNKVGGSPYHMRNHESSCTANPDRICKMCETLNGATNEPMPALLDVFGTGGDEGLERLREATENCPACILATIRQSGVNRLDGKPDANGLIEPHPGSVDFDWKKERQEAMSAINEMRNGNWAY